MYIPVLVILTIILIVELAALYRAKRPQPPTEVLVEKPKTKKMPSKCGSKAPATAVAPVRPPPRMPAQRTHAIEPMNLQSRGGLNIF